MLSISPKCRCSDQIVVPRRINRSSTDLLKAISGTVGSDPTAPHYKYHDDPYLTPVSNLNKRVYSLSRDSGRRAARWIRDKHGDLFQHHPDDPMIEKFLPKVQLTDDAEMTEDLLMGLIQSLSVTDAIKVYRTCHSKGVELTRDTLQSLLELVSFFNEEEPTNEILLEEHWYQQGVFGSDRIRNTWKSNGVAEQLFASLDPKDSLAYCAIICGFAKFYDVGKAMDFYDEAKRNGVAIDTETYNHLIPISIFLKDNSALKWRTVIEILTTMASDNVSPNLGTLNATLAALSQIRSFREARQLSLMVLAEFKQLGIIPHLAAYYYLLMIHCKERGPTSNILVDMLQKLESQELEATDSKDVFFFSKAMEVCHLHLKDLDVAHWLYEILQRGNNYQFIGDSFKESLFFHHYMALASQVDTFSNFMTLYNKLLPHRFTPDAVLMENIFRAVQVQEVSEYLPRLWSDTISFELTHQNMIIESSLRALGSFQPSLENEELSKKLAVTAWDIWTRVQERQLSIKQVKKVIWSGEMLGNLISCLTKCYEFDKGVLILHEILAKSFHVDGLLPWQNLQLILVKSISDGNSALALEIIEYAASCGYYEVVPFVEELQSSDTIDVAQKQKLKLIMQENADLFPVNEIGDKPVNN